MNETQLPAQGPVHRKVRPVIEAYKDFTGTSDDRFDTATDADMIGGAAYPGYDNFRAGWDAAIGEIAKEIDRLTWALDHGGHEYRRPATVDQLLNLLEKLKDCGTQRCELCADFDEVIHCINGCHDEGPNVEVTGASPALMAKRPC